MANSIWPHLPSSERQPKQAQASSLSAALYPSLTPQAKELDKARARDRERLLRDLRELNARLGRR
jgi:hypothetical protein